MSDAEIELQKCYNKIDQIEREYNVEKQIRDELERKRNTIQVQLEKVSVLFHYFKLTLLFHR